MIDRGPRDVRCLVLPLAACALAIAAFWPGAAFAQSADARAEAKERYDHGVDLFAQGDHGGALAEFKRAYELAPYPIVLYNVAQSYAALGKPVEAIEALDRVLAKPGTLSAERVERARTTRREQAALIGELAVTVSVDGARIEIDGNEVATSPLRAPLRMKGGPHRVGAVLGGYAPIRKEVEVPAGGRSEALLELVATDKKLAHLAVRTSVSAAIVLVDGEAVGVTPLAGSLAVLPGSRRVELRRAGYVTVARDVALAEGATGEVELEPAEDSAAVRAAGAFVSLDLSEDQAVVTVDGKARGPYAGSIALAPGPHRILVERGGFVPVERDVVAVPRRTTTVRVRFDPTPETRADYVSKAKRWKTLGWIGVGGGVAIVGGAIGFLVWNGSQRSDAEADAVTFNEAARDHSGNRCDQFAQGYSKPACEDEASKIQSRLDAADSRKVIGFIGLGVGAVAAGVGGYVLLTGDDPARYDRPASTDTLARVRVRPVAAIGPGGGFAGVAGAF